MNTSNSKKRLSSLLTFLFKYLLPIIWLIVFLSLTNYLFTKPIGPEPFFFIPLFIFGFIIYHLGIKVFDVHVDNQYLYLSRFNKSAKIPISEIKRVDEIVSIHPRLISIEFKKETVFGNQISFLGYLTILIFYEPHPVLILLKQQIEKYKNYES